MNDCPWCGAKSKDMMMESGVGPEQALEAHVQECESAMQELGL